MTFEHKERVIFHIDVNSAFLSWEAVRRLKAGETLDLRTVPSAVGGDQKSRHGVITAKSIPAKNYGIVTGEPVAAALRKCPQLFLVPPDFKLYQESSHAFIKICREYSEVLEQFSIDECFLDMTAEAGNDREKAVKLAYELKDRIRDELLFTVNVGVGGNKLLAKMASDFKKPDRVHTLFPDEIEKKMWPLPVGDLLFVGRSSVERLQVLGIRTIGDLAKMPESVLRSHFGEKASQAMHRSSNGMDDSPVQSEREDEKSVGNSTTLPYDFTTREEVLPVLLQLSESVAGRMRKSGVKGGLVTVTIRSSGFTTVSRQKKLDFHTYATDVIYEEAVRLFDSLWDQETPIRLLGVTCGALSDGNNEQMSLFGQEEREKREKLDEMLDRIRDKFGKDAVKRTGDYLREKERKKDGEE